MKLNRIYNMDFFEGMGLIEPGSVDLVLTDPPYGSTSNNWDKMPDLDRLWIAIKSVLRTGGCCND